MPGAVFHHTFFAMNTRLSIVLPGVAEAQGLGLIRSIERYVDQQETLLSRFRPGETYRLNHCAFDHAVDVSDALWAVLCACRNHNRRTHGLFDIAAGGLGKVAFDDQRQTVRFLEAGMRFDFGGVGKGIALAGVRDWLESRGIVQAFLSFGDSSIVAMGEHPSGGAWSVGLAGGGEATFDLNDQALSISGQTDNRRHIVDPRTGTWANGTHMVAVKSACPVEAEVLSTALFIASPKERQAILRNYDRTVAAHIDTGQATQTDIQSEWRDERRIS
ncbi:FAD:protein FMN transferase [Asticcacaulis sp. SL142]|uniref:FAD:protein FMN transferase n=1 Tax=Asticcacaulis sp. SL142 TaxID=2995155 RepID=UPI00226CF049|nr:FAD:protein FMN transferase [Asticcacaulis sp. SL142]WAC49181.1 FAD:protein FMN transferase [Asticcacaulis sp. SL142]